MSRCFPYPPPSYEKKVSDAALIESIKNAQERAGKERKRLRKQEKKEKKREEKEKHRPREDSKTQEKKDDSDKRHERGSISLFHKSVGDCKEGRDQESEQLERSSISEEHGQAVSIQCLHDSFDSIHGSVKRKKPETPTDACHSHLGGNLRIRLALSKQKDVGLRSGEPKACTSGHAEIPSKETPKAVARNCSNAASKIPAKEPLKTIKEFSCAAKIPAKEPHKAFKEHSGAAKFSAKEPLKAVKESISAANIPKEPLKAVQESSAANIPAKEVPKVARECRNAEDLMGSWKPLPPLQMELTGDSIAATIVAKGLPKAAREYRNAEDLMGSWKPIPLQMEHPDLDDLEWLFEGRQLCDEPDAKRQRADGCTSLVGSTHLGPRACYLAAGDVYALPYVLPF